MTETPAKKSLIEHFSALSDPRQAWKVEYPLPEIMLVVLCATLAGAETFVETARWGRMKLGFLRQLLPFERGIPSHDAMGCQTDIAKAVIAREASYLLALKDNQPSLAGEVELFFADPQRRPDTPHETVEADHGRVETRRHFVFHDVGWLGTDRRFPGEPRFPGLKAIAMVEATAANKSTGATARRYCISSLALDQAFFAKAVRAHWGPETASTGCSAPGKDSLRVKRKAAGWGDSFRLAIIKRQAQ